MSEKEFIRRVLQGEKKAIERFCCLFRPRLLRWVEKKVAAEEAEEIVQDTLMSALDSLPRFKGDSSLFTWLCAIARHEVVDFYRRKKIKQIVFSRLPFLENLVSQALGPELAYQELETKRRILKSLKHLSEGYREVLRLKYIDSLSVKEISQRLGQTVKAVESRLSRARLAFKKAYAFYATVKTEEEIFFEEIGEDWSSLRD
jgi:RNA polymerase sigma-70 factor (ECF subfamily)